ncbi:MAG TPA: MarR family transcriptional regulator [Deinococcales bacterium]|nr:MarR family transcriptional regulator [Deinococcales bacterium]
MTETETPAQRFFNRFYRANRALGGLLEAAIARDLNLEMRDFMVLSSIVKGHRHPGEIANRLHASKFTVSRALQKLGERGLVERTIDPEDSRRVLLEPTPQGLQTREAAISAMEESLEPLLESLGPDHTDNLITALELITENLTEVRSTDT